MIPASDVSAASHNSGRTAPRRSARMRTCCGLSSALMYSVGPGHQASSCSSSVLLPMPGSPPRRVTEPGTSPPSSTRSSSPMPVGRASPRRASMSWSSCSSAIGRGIVAGVSPPTSSTSVFHSPHPAHWPDHFGCAVPHSVQAWSVLVLVMPGASQRGVMVDSSPRSVARRAATDHRASRGPARRRRASHADRVPRLLPHRADPQGRGAHRRTTPAAPPARRAT